MTIPDTVSLVNDWSLKYSLEEVKRAALYAINHSEHGVNRCEIAGKIAKALSVSSLAKNTPSSLAGRGDH